MKMKKYKNSIRNWIRTKFSDQKLAEVYAWNRDGHMIFHDRCACILGVTDSATLHHALDKYGKPTPCKGEHYIKLHRQDDALDVEIAYQMMGWINFEPQTKGLENTRRRNIMSAILRAEMRRRDKEKQHETESRRTQLQDLVRV